MENLLNIFIKSVFVDNMIFSYFFDAIIITVL